MFITSSSYSYKTRSGKTMGHRKKHAPKRGSLAYSPRKRAEQIMARIRYWPKIELDEPTLLGFAGYKAGMTHVFMIESKEHSPNYGKEVIHPATVLEAPSMLICSIRVYTRDPYGLRAFAEAWVAEPPDELDHRLTMPESFDTKSSLKRIDENLDKVARIRVIALTQPEKASVPKKKPEIMEIEIGGGSIQQQLEYAKNQLGKTITPADVFKEGQYVDAIAVTTGKGFQGPVKRWGVRILSHKGRKTKRGVATLGPWKPTHLMHSVPRAGQMGFHQRTECNKLIIRIGTDGRDITPKGGFVRYGVVHGPYIILDGSIPGPEKRPIKLRYPTRPPEHVRKESPRTTYISLKSPQGK